MALFQKIISDVRKDIKIRKNNFQYVEKVENKLKTSLHKKCIDFPVFGKGNTIIAEIKMRSPSSGKISRKWDNPIKMAKEYSKGGASAISVLTEKKHFGGSLEYIEEVKKAVNIPVMRKDFIIDKFQIQEARAFGADGILLIENLAKKSLCSMLDYAHVLGMWAIVETNTKEEIQSSLNAGTEIIGINNRDLKTMKVDIKKSVRLSKYVPEENILVVESSINGLKDIKYLKENCERIPDAFLVGTYLTKSKNRTRDTKELVMA